VYHVTANLAKSGKGSLRSPATADPIVFVDTSVIGDGKVEELRTAVADLAAFVEANSGPQPSTFTAFRLGSPA
jgi:hypothetical protein